MLELTSFIKAIGSLERSIGAAGRIIKSGADNDAVETVKAGVVQNFDLPMNCAGNSSNADWNEITAKHSLSA